MSEVTRVQRYHVSEVYEHLTALMKGTSLIADAKGQNWLGYSATGQLVAQVVPPVLLPLDGCSLDTYLHECQQGLGEYLVILLQAGAAAVGLWHNGVLLHHKAMKKYVVRGRGRAQPAYLRTKGKSRYGSRLRLRNAQRLLVEVNEILHRWKPIGFERVYYSCPIRMWGELWRTRPPPPFDRRGPMCKIPLDVQVPTFAELLRVHDQLSTGKILYYAVESTPVGSSVV